MEIRVKSATYAMKGKQLLQRSGIRTYVGKRSGQDGCYYYLVVSDKNAQRALQALSAAQVII